MRSVQKEERKSSGKCRFMKRRKPPLFLLLWLPQSFFYSNANSMSDPHQIYHCNSKKKKKRKKTTALPPILSL